jgi:D-aminoacyl-tRNA deacylase
MILLVSSLKDIASLNIKEQILNYYPFKEISETFQQNPIYTADIKSDSVKLVTLREELVQAQHLPDSFPTSKLIVFISRHSSQSGKPTLSVHTPGNFAEAGLGGLPKTLSVSPATAMRDALLTLEHYKKTLSLNYEVSYECTHHGPSFSVPAMFVELGSSEPQWRDTVAAQAVAHAAMAAVTNFSSTAESAVIGIGGPHYNQKFTQITLTGEAVFGHMIPKYALANIDAEMLSQCVERTLERVSLAILDWKGIKSEDKAVVLSALQDVGLHFKKV